MKRQEMAKEMLITLSKIFGDEYKRDNFKTASFMMKNDVEERYNALAHKPDYPQEKQDLYSWEETMELPTGTMGINEVNGEFNINDYGMCGGGIEMYVGDRPITICEFLSVAGRYIEETETYTEKLVFYKPSNDLHKPLKEAIERAYNSINFGQEPYKIMEDYVYHLERELNDMDKESPYSQEEWDYIIDEMDRQIFGEELKDKMIDVVIDELMACKKVLGATKANALAEEVGTALVKALYSEQPSMATIRHAIKKYVPKVNVGGHPQYVDGIMAYLKVNLPNLNQVHYKFTVKGTVPANLTKSGVDKPFAFDFAIDGSTELMLRHDRFDSLADCLEYIRGGETAFSKFLKEWERFIYSEADCHLLQVEAMNFLIDEIIQINKDKIAYGLLKNRTGEKDYATAFLKKKRLLESRGQSEEILEIADQIIKHPSNEKNMKNFKIALMESEKFIKFLNAEIIYTQENGVEYVNSPDALILAFGDLSKDMDLEGINSNIYAGH